MENVGQAETASPAFAKQRVSEAGSSSWTGTRSTIRNSILSPYPIPGDKWTHKSDSESRHSSLSPMLDETDQSDSRLFVAQHICSCASQPRSPPRPMLAHPPSPAPCLSPIGPIIPISRIPPAGSGIFEREAYFASALDLPLDLLTLVENPVVRSGLRTTMRRWRSPLLAESGPRCFSQERSPSHGGDILRKRQEQGRIRTIDDLGKNARRKFLKSQTPGAGIERSQLREVEIGEIYSEATLCQDHHHVCLFPLF